MRPCQANSPTPPLARLRFRIAQVDNAWSTSTAKVPSGARHRRHPQRARRMQRADAPGLDKLTFQGIRATPTSLRRVSDKTSEGIDFEGQE
jgi:hypothetical protein